MLDQELLDDFLEALEASGSPVKNPELRRALGWSEAVYEQAKAALVARKSVVRGRGRSDVVSLVGAEAAEQLPAATRGSLEVTQKPVAEQLLASPEAPIIP